jgi:16S rRNA (adenine1518-N6/adenine1519-N6)-dimethyltransferase
MLERVTEAAWPAPQDAAPVAQGLPGALDALEKLGIDAQRRAETLTVADFVAIARALSNPT